MEFTVANSELLLLLLGVVLGVMITWLWRGTELAKRAIAEDHAKEALRQSELDGASLRSELDAVLSQSDELKQRVIQIQHARDQLAAENAGLAATQAAEKEKHAEQIALLDKSKAQLRLEFENLANKIFEERGKQLTAHNQHSVESLLKPFGEQIHRFQSRINEVHEQSIRGNENLASELRTLMGVGLKMSDQAENLTRALKGDKKTTGNWGEVQLERTLQLAGLERGTHYEAQTSFRNEEGKLRIPDFVVNLPDGKHLIIDSKVSLVDYDRAVSAETGEEREEALKAHSLALRRHMDDLSSKDYSSLAAMNSPELVFMFMPIEAAYIEALKYNRELFNDGYRKNIIMVSHTTLLPMLRTVASLWIAYRSNQEAREISEMAGDIYNKVRTVGERVEDMGKTLSTLTNKYNSAVTSLVGKQGLYGKVERFSSISSKAKGELPEPAEQHPNIEHDRLRLLKEDKAPQLSAVDGTDADPDVANSSAEGRESGT